MAPYVKAYVLHSLEDTVFHRANPIALLEASLIRIRLANAMITTISRNIGFGNSIMQVTSELSNTCTPSRSKT